MTLDNINDLLNNNNNEDLDRLADKVFAKIIEKYGDIYPLRFTTDQEEILMGELARLSTMLEMLKDREEYEKCAIVQNRIRHITKKLENL